MLNCRHYALTLVSPGSLTGGVINQMLASVHAHVRVSLMQSVPVWRKEEEEEADI